MRMFTDTKIAAPVATITAGTGVAEWLNWIPNDIGKLATVAGIGLSCVLIVTHLFRFYLEFKEHRQRMESLRNNPPRPEDDPGQ